MLNILEISWTCVLFFDCPLPLQTSHFPCLCMKFVRLWRKWDSVIFERFMDQLGSDIIPTHITRSAPRSKRQLVGAQVAVVRGGEVICNLAHGTLLGWSGVINAPVKRPLDAGIWGDPVSKLW